MSSSKRATHQGSIYAVRCDGPTHTTRVPFTLHAGATPETAIIAAMDQGWTRTEEGRRMVCPGCQQRERASEVKQNGPFE